MKKINIPLSDQVVDLETARELTEKLASVGIEVESVYYYNSNYELLIELQWHEDTRYYNTVNTSVKTWRSIGVLDKTYTLPELLEVLPDEIDGHQLDLNTLEYIKYVKDTHNCNAPQSLGYDKEGCMPYFKCRDEKLSATAAAKLLIWYIDNGYVKGGAE